MDKKLIDKLLTLAKKKIDSSDPSHDLGHVLRVLANAKKILKSDGGDRQDF